MIGRCGDGKYFVCNRESLSNSDTEFRRATACCRASRCWWGLGNSSKSGALSGGLQEVDDIVTQFQGGTGVILLEQFSPFTLLEEAFAFATFGVIVGHGRTKGGTMQFTLRSDQ
jgi:hypothetical protein